MLTCLLPGVFSSLLHAQSKDTLSSPVLLQGTRSIIGIKPDENNSVITTGANLSELNINDAPSVMSVITAKEIEEMGYPDLTDILNLFPGIQVASDVQNCNGIGIRGNWANEGKLLFMIDGIQINDMAYGSIVMGLRFPTINISRIEFIRSSGSSIYGGLAGLGVINIITKKGQELSGHSIVTGMGYSRNAVSQARIAYCYGGQLIKGVELSVIGLINSGFKSNEQVVLPDSSQVNFRDSSQTNCVYVNLLLKYRSLKFQQMYEDYNWQSTYEAISSLFRTSHTELSYQLKRGAFSVTPYAFYKWQIPWNNQYGDPKQYDVQNIVATRFSGGLTAEGTFFKKLKFVGGLQGYTDYMRYYRKALYLKNGKPDARFNGVASFLEFNYSTRFANFFAGARVDRYAHFQAYIAPRLSVTKAFKFWHYKLIYGQALKIPTLQNINLSDHGNISPEHLTEMQAELGLSFRHIDVAVNVFDNTISNYIFYKYDLNTLTEFYQNMPGRIEVVGAELSAALKWGPFRASLAYANYYNRHNDIRATMVDSLDPSAGNLAFSRHKLSSTLSFRLSSRYSVTLTNIYRSGAYSYVQVNATSGEYGKVYFKPTDLLSVGFQSKNNFGFFDYYVGVRNCLNTHIYNLYPYQSGYQPTLDMGRELIVKLKFNL